MDRRSNNLKITLGQDDFKKMATEHDVYVDKSLFIKEIIDSNGEGILITYPRRWGKSLNIDMLKTFFEKKIQQNPYNTHYLSNDVIFKGGNITLESGDERVLKPLQISTIDSGKYMRHQGKHPVISLTLKGVDGDTWETIQEQLRLVISDLYAKHKYLLDYLSGKDKRNLKTFQSIYYNHAKSATEAEIQNSLFFLSELLHVYHGRRTYVLVDEYDKPINTLLDKYFDNTSSKESDLIKTVNKFISQVVCGSVGKGNIHLEKLILTGIFDTTYKESGSGCNNLAVYTISDIKFSKYFGFSKSEVRGLVDRLEFDNKDTVLEQIKKWYNGYRVQISANETSSVYTPWSVMRYLDKAYTTGDLTPQSYWTKSGVFSMLTKLVSKELCRGEIKLRDKLRNLLKGEPIVLELDHQVSLSAYDVTDLHNTEKVFAYLLSHSGYLTVEQIGQDYTFRIPNLEVREEFENIIRHMARPREGIDTQYALCGKESLSILYKDQNIKVFNAIISGDQKTLEEIFQRKVKCSDSSLNFNYLHIASISNNPEVMKTLIAKCGDNIHALLNAKDQTFGLNTIDYLKMRYNNSYEPDFLKPYANVTESLQIPGWVSSIPCHWGWIHLMNLGASMVSTMITTPIIKKGIQKLPEGIQKYLTPGGAIGIALLMFGGLETKEVFKFLTYQDAPTCKEYKVYSETSSAKPQDLNSMGHFKEFSLKNINQSYVVLGDKCNDADIKFKSITAPIFSYAFLGTEEFTFTLCGSKDLAGAYNIHDNEL